MKISVIIPSYNCEKTIRQSIDSVLSQTGAEIEIIVVNDGSTDNTEKILEEYNGKIKIITIENNGVANARNTALQNATGDYIMFVDADDMLADGAIKEITSEISKTGADIVRFEYITIDENNKKTLTDNRFTKYEFIEKKISLKKYIHSL